MLVYSALLAPDRGISFHGGDRKIGDEGLVGTAASAHGQPDSTQKRRSG
jgi:hypothetical protein